MPQRRADRRKVPGARRGHVKGPCARRRRSAEAAARRAPADPCSGSERDRCDGKEQASQPLCQRDRRVALPDVWKCSGPLHQTMGHRGFKIKYDASLSQNGERTTSTWFSSWRHISSHADKSATPSLPPREITFLIVSHYTAALCHSTQSIWVIITTRPTHRVTYHVPYYEYW